MAPEHALTLPHFTDKIQNIRQAISTSRAGSDYVLCQSQFYSINIKNLEDNLQTIEKAKTDNNKHKIHAWMSGFQQHHSTETALTKVFIDICLYTDSCKISV